MDGCLLTTEPRTAGARSSHSLLFYRVKTVSVSTANNRSRRAEIHQRISTTNPTNPAGYRQRLLWVWILLALGLCTLVGRLFWLQVFQHTILRERAQAQQLTQLRPHRALHPIIDRDGKLLAKDEPMFRLFAHPKLFSSKKTPTEIAAALAPIIQLKEGELVKLFQSGETGIPIIRDLSEDTAEKIRALALDGLELTPEWKRVYPRRDLMSGIVGYVNADHLGQAGLEYSLRSLLNSKPPSSWVSEDGQGLLLPERFPLGPLNAEDRNLKLTLDSQIQWSARSALLKKMKEFQAKRGTVIAMNVQDGSLLALASEPSFDPEKFYASDPALFKNWAVSDLYEPGSTFKPINVAIALDAKAIKPTDIVNDVGHISVGGWPIQNNDGGAYGPINITKVLEVSSNIGMVRIMEQVPRKIFYDYLERIGIGKRTATDLPFETAGQTKDKTQFIDYPIEAATTAFGQGFSVTPIQMAQLHASLGNGGKLVTPHVTDGLYDPFDKLIAVPQFTPPRQIFAKSTADSVLKMMGSVVMNGTGKPAQIPGYRLGGKTGTAQKADGGAYQNARITSFVALFPVEKPKYVVIAVVDEPQGSNAYGSTVAAPVVKSVLETLISVEGIPPSHPEEIRKIEAPKATDPKQGSPDAAISGAQAPPTAPRRD
jgi:cell division protein FtsI (penicillin-binding protein 3)